MIGAVHLPDTDLLAIALAFAQMNHDDYIARNRAIFFELPPDDFDVYAYTYYDGNDDPIYHGYTTDARQRASEHQKKAPWASWVERVRYRRCPDARSARRLESRLQRKVPSLCHVNGRTMTYHGADWSEIDKKLKINHVTGDCRLPCGLCDPGEISRRIATMVAS